MAFFSSAPSTSTASVPAPNPVKEQIKQQISQELAVANATELVNNATENCFQKCMAAPYHVNNEGCVDQCLEKYMRSWNVISRAYIGRIQNASNKGEI